MVVFCVSVIFPNQNWALEEALTTTINAVKNVNICVCVGMYVHIYVYIYPWRRKWQPAPVFLPGKFHGQRSLAGYSPWGRKESDMTEHSTHRHTDTHTYTHIYTHIYTYLSQGDQMSLNSTYIIKEFSVLKQKWEGGLSEEKEELSTFFTSI